MLSDNKLKFRQILTDNGYRITSARIKTFDLLLSDEPQSINQILTKANSSVDRVSIYRNVVLFEHLGIVNRIYIGWKYKLELSDDFMDHHHHLVCLKCHKVIDIGDEKHIDKFIRSIAKKSGFTPRKHIFEIDGYCADCQPSSSL